MKKKILSYLLIIIPMVVFSQQAKQSEENDIILKPILESPPMSESQAESRSAEYKNWGIERLHFDTILSKYTGKGLKGCVCDTGLPDHKAYSHKIVGSKNFSSAATVDDKFGHSTHVAGIWHEIAPDMELIFGKCLNDQGSGSNTAVANCVRWAYQSGASVINLSLGGSYPSEELHQAIIEAKSNGSTVVVAAGNSGKGEKDNIGYPGKYFEPITVGSIDEDLSVSYFSSSGPEGDIVAPGGKILSTYLNNTYIVQSGTSMATPYVAGVVTLLRDAYGNDGNIQDRIKARAFDLLPPGFDRYSFEGVISPAAFVNIDGPGPDPLPEPDKFNIFEQWWFWTAAAVALIFLVWRLIVFIRKK